MGEYGQLPLNASAAELGERRVSVNKNRLISNANRFLHHLSN